MAMKKCKECGEEISSSAKKCPKCGKDQRNFYMKHPVIYTILILLLIGIVAGSSSDTPIDTKSTLNDSNTKAQPTSSTDTTSTKTAYNVGEIWESSSHAIKYVSVDQDYKGYNRYADVKDGYKIIKADFEAENLGTTDFYFSAYEFDCYADGYDCENFWSFDESGFSSTLSSGKKARGTVCFQVPIDAEKISIEYEDNLWSSNKIEFIVK